MAIDTAERLRRVQAVLFDVDGTLYLQLPLRLAMALEMALLPIRLGSMADARRTWAFLRAFREVQDELRDRAPGGEPPAQQQLLIAAERTGVSPRLAEALVTRWMVHKPLRYLPWLRRPGLTSLLRALESLGLKAGAMSDYPAVQKLRAMGIADSFSVVLCTAEPPVAALKPAPAGFLAAAAAWGIGPASVLYVGDREDVDARGAAAAGMPCLVVTRAGLRRAVAEGLLPAEARGPAFARLEAALRRARHA